MDSWITGLILWPRAFSRAFLYQSHMNYLLIINIIYKLTFMKLKRGVLHADNGTRRFGVDPDMGWINY